MSAANDSSRDVSRITTALLALLVFVAPLATLELALRPLWLLRRPSAMTSIFQRDDELGWRLRPRAADIWGDVLVRINEYGLRGPALPYENVGDSMPILWLGDSVTFGYLVARDEDTFPHRVELELEKRLGGDVETINAGLGGYSPWQQLVFLEREGLCYDPDLVVVSFVLNDVTEKLELRRFRGVREGFQVESTVSPWALTRYSAVVFSLRKAVGRLTFGADIQAGAAHEEMLDVHSLVYEPDKPGIAEAWRVTLANLEAIFARCEREGIGAALVIFPFTFQFEDPVRLSEHQRIVREFADSRGIANLDLLPFLYERLKGEGRSEKDFFYDWDHPTELGNRLIGDRIAEFLISEELVTAR